MSTMTKSRIELENGMPSLPPQQLNAMHSIDWRNPHIVIPKPPTDNRIWRARSGLRKGAMKELIVAAHMGETAFRRAIMKHTYTTTSLTPEARTYVNDVRHGLGCPLYRTDEKARSGVRFRSPFYVPDGEVAFLMYRQVFKDRRRDAGSVKKIVEDTLFDQDRYVHTTILPISIDKVCERVEVWLYRLPLTLLDFPAGGDETGT